MRKTKWWQRNIKIMLKHRAKESKKHWKQYSKEYKKGAVGVTQGSQRNDYQKQMHAKQSHKTSLHVGQVTWSLVGILRRWGLWLWWQGWWMRLLVMRVPLIKQSQVRGQGGGVVPVVLRRTQGWIYRFWVGLPQCWLMKWLIYINY